MRSRISRGCGKVCYRDRLAAMIALADIDRRRKRDTQSHKRRAEKRIYECPRCRAWHLTSDDPPEGALACPA